MLGWLLVLYPQVAQVLNQRAQSAVVSELQARFQLEQRDLADLNELERINTVMLARVQAPVNPADESGVNPRTPADSSALELLKAGLQGEAIATVELPAVGLAQPVYYGATIANLRRGAALVEGTSFPLGGDSTHCVIAGHTGHAGAVLFNNLRYATVGDVIYLATIRERIAYRVINVREIAPDQAEALTIQPGRDLCSLLTCTWRGSLQLRLLVTGERIPLP